MEHKNRPLAEQQKWKLRARLPYCQIWEESNCLQTAEAYPVENYGQMHARIDRNKPHVVNSLGCVVDPETGRSLLLVERVPNRLSEVMTVNESQSLKLLYSIFLGLYELEPIYGIIELTPSCICFNEEGKVKIWVNSDLSSIHPEINIKKEVTTPMIIKKVLQMVEEKCFNSGFFKKFAKKIEEGLITSFSQAAQEILKIGELLFIQIEEKTVQEYFQKSNPHYSSQVLQHNSYPENVNACNSTKQIREEIIEAKRNERREFILGVHSRKLSNQELVKKPECPTRYQSFLENYSESNSKITNNSNIHNISSNSGMSNIVGVSCYPNISQFSQKNPLILPQNNGSSTSSNSTLQSETMSSSTNSHKSAPLSPRDGQGHRAKDEGKSGSSQKINSSHSTNFIQNNTSSQKNPSSLRTHLQSNSQKCPMPQIQRFIKKPSELLTIEKNPIKKMRAPILPLPRKLEYMKKNCPTIKEDSKSEDDSFSNNLRVEENENDIFVSGQFQTFGILEDFDDSAPRSPKFKEVLESSLSKEENENKNDFNVKDLDIQLQKKLSLKANKEKEKKKLNFLKFTTSTSPMDLKSKICDGIPFKSIGNKMQSGSNVMNRMPSPLNNGANSLRSKSITLYCPKSQEKETSRVKTIGDVNEDCAMSISYIDKKYEEFLSTVKNEESKKMRCEPIKYNLGHFKHVSNLERMDFKNNNVTPVNNGKNLNTGNNGNHVYSGNNMKRIEVYPQSHNMSGFGYQILSETSRFCQEPLSNRFSTQR